MSKNEAELLDWYKVIPKKFLTKSHNPFYHVHGLKVPFYGLLIGSSGAGKTQTLLNIMHNMKETFNNIYIITKNKNEPLYTWIEEKLGKDGLQVLEGINNAPDLDKLNKKEQTLIVFDDLVLEKNQEKIEEMFIRARKLNASVIYISQDYYRVPTIVRHNLTYLFIKRLSTLNDLYRIMREYSTGVDKSQLKKMYDNATIEKKDFLLVDLESDVKDRFRKNFNEIYDIEPEK